jgi:hypothetical protein
MFRNKKSIYTGTCLFDNPTASLLRDVGLSDSCFVPADDKRFFETLLQYNVAETDFMLNVIRLSIPRSIPAL